MFVSARVTDAVAVQAAHKVPTPRIGGLAVFGAIALGLMVAPPDQIGPGWRYLLSTLPVLLVGLGEDITRKVSARLRYLAAVFSGALAIILLGIWIDRMDVPPLGFGIFMVAPVGILVTLFVTSSYAHAFNLTDGLNALASGLAVIAGLAMSVMAMRVGAPEMVMFLGIQVSAFLGFMALNFPRGKLFLGDAGAYSMGHLLAWSALGVYAVAPDVTCWSLLLVFFWPMADTLFAMYRRLSVGKSIDCADRMHFHQVIMRVIEIHWLGRNARHRANPIATLVILPFAALPAILGVLLMYNSLAAFLALIGCGAMFVLTYNVILAMGAGRSVTAQIGRMVRQRARRLRGKRNELALANISDGKR
ncbi:MAG: UDP-phosphate N-acetylglucosaminyl 1-phosphate transferase [Rhodobacteraceae bacterium]|nr:UDP-phosphate N-acetylglucosaminyl 1-phosphate transferase [Paracoccaceae bacterium]